MRVKKLYSRRQIDPKLRRFMMDGEVQKVRTLGPARPPVSLAENEAISLSLCVCMHDYKPLFVCFFALGECFRFACFKVSIV